jgi:hypothetical protein
MQPKPQSVRPKGGKPGTNFFVTINGEALDNAVGCKFGPQRDIDLANFSAVSPTEVRVELFINKNAQPGSRDVTVINSTDQAGVLPNGFLIQ